MSEARDTTTTPTTSKPSVSVDTAADGPASWTNRTLPPSENDESAGEQTMRGGRRNWTLKT
jgi:hypothetical protein